MAYIKKEERERLLKKEKYLNKLNELYDKTYYCETYITNIINILKQESLLLDKIKTLEYDEKLSDITLNSKEQLYNINIATNYIQNQFKDFKKDIAIISDIKVILNKIIKNINFMSEEDIDESILLINQQISNFNKKYSSFNYLIVSLVNKLFDKEDNSKEKKLNK